MITYMKYLYIISPENVYLFAKCNVEIIPKQKIKKSLATATPWYVVKNNVISDTSAKNLILLTLWNDFCSMQESRIPNSIINLVVIPEFGIIWKKKNPINIKYSILF